MGAAPAVPRCAHAPPPHPQAAGRAGRRGAAPDAANDIDEPVRKRLVRAGTAPDLTSLSQRLRDLVVLLRRLDIPLDYGLLAGQLYAWQWPGGAGTVRREWGRSFHSRQGPATATGTSAEDTPDSADSDKDAS